MTTDVRKLDNTMMDKSTKMLSGSKRCGNCWFYKGRCLSSPRNENRGKIMRDDDGLDCAYWITEGANVEAEIKRYLGWKGEDNAE